MKIDQSKIVVTGGAGLIGSTTVDLLLKEHSPRSVVIFDDFSRGSRANIEEAMRDPRVSVVEGDVRDRAAVARVMAGADAVIHMAALRITACAAEPRLAFLIADLIAAKILFGQAMAHAEVSGDGTMQAGLRVIVVMAIWVPYILNSRRVRNTFVQ